MTKKAAPKIYFILLLLFILLTGCSGKKTSESAVSPEAEAVINAMFTAPNEELYSPDASTVIGENNDANSDDAFANSEKILENWNKLVGKYFESSIDKGNLLYVVGGGIGYNLYGSTPLQLTFGVDNNNSLVMNLIISTIVF